MITPARLADLPLLVEVVAFLVPQVRQKTKPTDHRREDHCDKPVDRGPSTMDLCLKTHYFSSSRKWTSRLPTAPARVRERIDSYTIKTLRGYKQYEISREDFYGFYDDLQFMEIKTEQQNNFAGSFLYVLGEMSTIREKLEYLTNRKVEFSIKVADYTLGILLIALLFMNRNDPFTNIIFILVSTIIVFIFLIIEDFDNLRIADYSANISNSEQIFDLIRRERYYPQRLLSRVKLEEGRKYRIGIYNSKLKEEEIFEIIYNSVFKIKINKILEKFKGRDK